MLRDFEHALDEVERSSASVLATVGQGRAFSAGSDLKELASRTPEEAEQLEAEHGRIFSLLDSLPQITVAGWRGHVLGGGMFMGVYHDFRVASEAAHIGLPEVAHGWTPPWGVSRLAELVGRQVAYRFLLTGLSLNGMEAQEIGLADAALPDESFDEDLREWVETLASRPKRALSETKALMSKMRAYDHDMWDREACVAFRRCYGTSDARRAVEKFLKRK